MEKEPPCCGRVVKTQHESLSKLKRQQLPGNECNLCIEGIFKRVAKALYKWSDKPSLDPVVLHFHISWL